MLEVGRGNLTGHYHEIAGGAPAVAPGHKLPPQRTVVGWILRRRLHEWCVSPTSLCGELPLRVLLLSLLYSLSHLPTCRVCLVLPVLHFVLFPALDAAGPLAVVECYGHLVMAVIEQMATAFFGLLSLAGINPVKGVF